MQEAHVRPVSENFSITPRADLLTRSGHRCVPRPFMEIHTMAHAYYHAVSSARTFGGKPEDCLAIHSWFDETKQSFCDFRHRALRHHSEGIFEAERHFGVTITNSAGRAVPVRYIGEQHVMED